MLFKKKSLLLITGYLLCILQGTAQLQQEMLLPTDWKFKAGDDAGFTDPDYNDRQWKKIRIDQNWELQGYAGYNGRGMYRTRITLPSSLKKQAGDMKALRLFLGPIDDNDETFFNGHKIGETAGWDIDRSYLIPVEWIRWDQENVFAIRVDDFAGNGGMIGNQHYIGKIRLADLLILHSKDYPIKFDDHRMLRFDKRLHFNFKVPIDKIEGTIHVSVFNDMGKVVFQKNERVLVGNKADSLYPFSMDIQEPGTYKISYSFYSESFADTVKYRTLLSYISPVRTTQKIEYPKINLNRPGRSQPFNLDSMQFAGYLGDRLNANLTKRLLNIDETGILECYYNRPGKQTWVGEYAGKYLHAASRVWLTTKNAELKDKMDRMVDILIACQLDDGYLGTYLPADYWKDWDVWAHKYNLLGLLSYFSVTGHQPALETSIRMGDLLCKTFGEQKGQLNIIHSSGHVGMASTSVLEPMIELYRFTGYQKYLDFCKYIIRAYDDDNGPKIVSSLIAHGKVNKTANAKAYEMMSNLTGIVKLYQLTGEEKLLKAADRAWNDIATSKLYITGTASKEERFQEDFVLPADNNVHMGEGCVTTTWLQFSQALYYLSGNSKYIDEIEKTIYNHLLAAENPQTGCVSYYTALQGKKPYRCTIDAHCCLASIPRGIAAIPELAYARDSSNGLYINLYSPGKINGKIITSDGKKVVVNLHIDTEFPEKGQATINIHPATNSQFKLYLRVPEWCKNFTATVKGIKHKGIPGQYLPIERLWEKNSKVNVLFDLNPHSIQGGKSYPGYIAIKSGAQVLAVDQALNPGIKNLDELLVGTPNLSLLSKSKLPKGWVGSQIFTTSGYYEGKAIRVLLLPFADAGQTNGDVRVWIKKK